MTEEEMDGPILFWGYKEQESNLILPEHDDDDDNPVQILLKMFMLWDMKFLQQWIWTFWSSQMWRYVIL